ncbi:MAG: porin family protein [Bacteroidia bacterium]
MKLLIIFSLICCTLLVKAQTDDCLETISKANTAYERGNFNEVLTQTNLVLSDKNLITSCKWQAYRLQALSYLADGKINDAKKAVENLLELNPTYKASNIKDPAELVKLIKSITVIPKFSLGLAFSLGTNSTFPQISTYYLVSDYTKKYSVQNGFQIGASTAYYVSSQIAVEVNFLGTQKEYTIDYNMENWNLKTNERLTYFDIPIQLKYFFLTTNRLRPYIQAGFYGGYLLFAENSFYAEFKPLNQKYNLEKINSTERRNAFSFGYVTGAGISYKLKNGFTFIQANYFGAINKLNKPETRYDNNDILYSFYYLDDDLKLNNLAISVGYNFILNYKVERK